MRNGALRAGLVVAALGFAGSFACGGVSVRYTVESDMRFEHCYRIDEDTHVSLGEKRACWAEWREKYQRGQDPNRIGYAAERLRVIDAAASSGASPSATVATDMTAACPLPKSPYAPPPTTATQGTTLGANAPPPDVTCSDGCHREWKNCAPACGGEMGCLDKCDGKLRVCMKACFSP